MTLRRSLWPHDVVELLGVDHKLYGAALRLLFTEGRSCDGFIYFATIGTGTVKIGFAKNVAGRIAIMQSDSPFPVTLLGVVPGSRADERKLHELFAEERERGEWFRGTDELLLAVHGMVDLFEDDEAA